jgi:DNA-binding NtrC family response regulator
MEEDKIKKEESDEDMFDDADRPFDFVGADEQTAIVCETDDEIRKNICSILEGMDFQITESSSIKDALRNMRYHEYDIIFINENADDEEGNNDILAYLESISMSVRRKMFVVLLSTKYRTMDNMAAFIKSVNMVLNTQNLPDLETILNRGIAINEVFYNVFKEAQRMTGRN